MNSRVSLMLGAVAVLSGAAQAGVMEICKDSDPAGSLDGFYSFVIAGQEGTVMVPVGACTGSFLVPDGTATITEIPVPGSYLEAVYTFPESYLIGLDLQSGTATVVIAAGDLSDPSGETVVTFINASAVPEPGTATVASITLGLFVVYPCWRKHRAGGTGRRGTIAGVQHVSRRLEDIAPGSQQSAGAIVAGVQRMD